MLVVIAACVAGWHCFRGQLVGSVKGLLQGEAMVPGSTPSIFVRRFAEGDGAFAHAELQVGLVDSRKSLALEAGSAEGLAQLLREAGAWARGGP